MAAYKPWLETEIQAIEASGGCPAWSDSRSAMLGRFSVMKNCGQLIQSSLRRT